jgi:membrane protein implicated in regulation of membrane protease activity
MMSLIGMPLVVAAWAVPALFLLMLGGVLAFVVGRPFFLLWGRVVDHAIGTMARGTLWVAEGLATRSYDCAVRHVGRDR